jgi:hypothetical protein
MRGDRCAVGVGLALFVIGLSLPVAAQLPLASIRSS